MACCISVDHILLLLKSKDKDDVIFGAYKAGECGNKIFIPLLLKDAGDERRSTNLRFLGITVYQSKMSALQKILGVDPPSKITYKVDSSIIKFYLELSNK
jgi:hypothetical protein